MNPAFLNLPGTLPQQPSLDEASCSLIPCPKTGPNTGYWALVKERRVAARITFERVLREWTDGNYMIVPEIAEKWWPGTGVSSRNSP